MSSVRRTLLGLGPALPDIDKAVDCGCSCHPREANLSLHEGGVTCNCQQTPAQRKASMEAFFAASAALGDIFDESEQEFDDKVKELGVDAHIRVAACPLVITGVVDGVSFYYRERHDVYTVEVPVDLSANADLYKQYKTPSQTIAEGSGYFPPADALVLSVQAVKDFMTRKDCLHPDAQAFCPVCGERM